jgi:hypothetical protein
MSPTLLSKRLKELEKSGVITASPSDKHNVLEYRLTPAGEELRSIVMRMGVWGQRWIDAKLSLNKLDPSLLMWDMRRRLNPKPLQSGRCTLKFHFSDARASQRDWWLVIDEGKVDLCGFDPGHDVNLYITASLKALTAIWLGLSSIKEQQKTGELEVLGDRKMALAMEQWLGFSAFAQEKKLAA